MAETVYILCAVTSCLCAFMLARRYMKSRIALLLWSTLSFLGLALNNLILFIDKVLLPHLDFSGGLWRNLLGAIAGGLLLFGLIWETTT